MAQYGMTDAHKAALRSNRLTLVKELHVDETFLSVLMEHKILSDIQKENIDAIAVANRTKRASWVIDFIPKKGPNAMKAFIYALMVTDQRHLADMLDLIIANQWRQEHPDESDTDSDEIPTPPDNPDNPTVVGMQESAEGAAAPAGYMFNRDGHSDIITPETADIDIKFTKTDRGFAHRIAKDQMLNFTVVEKGLAVIINVEHFTGCIERLVDGKPIRLTDRMGTQQDVKNMKRLLDRLGYKVDCWNNLNKIDIEAKLKQCANSEEHGDSLIVVILSHGYNGGFYSADSKEFPIKKIVQSFSEWLCLPLRGKPKMFFIQACQGSDRTTGVSLPLEAMDEGDAASEVEIINQKFRNLGIDDKDITRETTLSEIIGDEQNIFLAFSTVPKYVSVRHERNGTWFIRDLVTVIASRAHEKYLQEMMTEVISRVSQRKSKKTLKIKNEQGVASDEVVEYVQISCTKDSLSKKVYFLPGI